MKLHQTFQMLLKGQITFEEAAQRFQTTPRDLKFRMTKHGSRLQIILKTLDRIHDDDITRNQAAALLGVSQRQVNHLMVRWGVTRPLREYLVHRAVSAVKWEIRKKYAIEFIAGSCTLEEAAENANVSTRQMRRWVADLLKKHMGIVYKDIKPMPLAKRYRIADRIEAAEGLETAKQNVLREVSLGKKAIEDVALERVMSKRAIRRSKHV